MEKRKIQWHEAVSSAVNLPCLKEVSQGCLVFDVVKLKKLRKTRRICVFDVINFQI